MGVEQAGARRSAGLIGRDAESMRLAAAIRAAQDGRSACVLLVGEAGVGKTRLLTETATSARSAGMAVFVGRAAIASPTPFGVIAEALRSWHRKVPLRTATSPLARGLQLVIPEWAPTGAEPGLSEPQLRLLAFEGVVQLLRDAASSHAGVLVVLDDLHAADPESVETARYLAAAAVDGVCVIAGMRRWEGRLADELVRGLSRDEGAELIEVEPLDPPAVAQLVQALTGAAPPADFVGEIITRTDGLPLLVEEIVSAHLRAGSIDITNQALVWRGDAVAVPRTVREMVSARLDRLEPAHREVICAGAILGDFRPDLLAAVSEVPEVDAAIEAAARTSLLDVSGEVAFHHAILREAILDSIGTQAKVDLHRRAATALARLGGDDAPTLERRARHHEALGDGDEAARLLTVAVGHLLRSHALLGAEQLARAALAQALHPVRRVGASDAIAEALVAQGRWTEALEVDSATTAAYGEDPPRRRRMALAALEAGRPDFAAELIAYAFAAGDETLSLLILDGREAIVTGDAERTLRRADFVLASSTADIDERLAALDLKGRAYDFLGRRDLAEAAWCALAAQASANGRTQAELRAAVALGKIELFAGKAGHRLRAAVELAQSAGAFVELGWAEENLAIGLLLGGEVDEALRIVDAAIERCRRLRLDQVAYLLVVRGMAETYRGGDAEPWLRDAETMLSTADLRLHTASGRGDMALRDGRYDDAVRWLAECTEIMAAMPGIVPMDSPCWLVWALIAAGRENDARAALDDARQLPDLVRWHTRPVLLDAAAALLQGDAAAVDAIVAAAADHLTPSDIGTMRLLGAEVVTGERRVEWLREALEIFDTIGMTPTAQRVRRLLRDAGAPVPRMRRAGEGIPAALAARGVTRRETEVLQLLGDGLSNSQIADRLVLSVRTVEAHVSSLLAKCGVERRAQLVAISAADD
ncbi:MAG TPA: AAA family ATPase [Mycobacteriales bacterium]|nr:AAA family ATPase [Mycobacteriales bacterium]